jgi:hypothetical protein
LIKVGKYEATITSQIHRQVSHRSETQFSLSDVSISGNVNIRGVASVTGFCSHRTLQQLVLKNMGEKIANYAHKSIRTYQAQFRKKSLSETSLPVLHFPLDNAAGCLQQR